MTESKQKRGLPVWAVILDVLGTLLLAAGIYGIVSGELRGIFRVGQPPAERSK